jgi:L-threonylcarbamoyladenylate synthase
MKPEIIKVTKNNYRLSISVAKESLDKGNVIVIPTGTCYVLAANAFNESAVEKVYTIKKRVANKPVSCLINGEIMAGKIAILSSQAKLLIRTFFPGPLTLVLNKNPGFKTISGKTIGVTSAKQDFCIKLIKAFNKPVTGTSSNPSGGHTPYNVKDIINQFSEKDMMLIDRIFDLGKLPGIRTSTVIDITQSSPKILRKGPITKQEIEKVLKVTIEDS